MPEYSIVTELLQLGGVIRQDVDLATGELRVIPVRGDTIPAGLSNPHICTRDFKQPEGYAEYWLDGSLMRCAKPTAAQKRVGGGVRGKVSIFTAGSRRRLMYTMGKIQRAALPVMITLTYPAEYPSDGETWKNHLRRWWQRLARKVKKVGGIWKLEPQKRGAPHFHLLVWGLDRVSLYELREWVSRSWYQVVGSNNLDHLHAGTRVETVKSHRGVMSYAAKYLGKLPDGEAWENPGRYWGTKGSDFIPWASLVRLAINYREAVQMLRLMRRVIHCKRGNLPGLSILCGNPEYWFDRFGGLTT